MKKSLLATLALAAAIPAVAQFTTAGNGQVYTFAQIAQVDTSGVTVVDGAYQVAQNITVAAGDTLRLENNDVVKLATGVTVDINGFADFTPADTAYITHLEDGGYARFTIDGQGIDIKNVTTDYVGYNFYAREGKFTAENSSFRYFIYKSTTTTSSAAINLAYSPNDNVIKNCYFIESSMAAISSPTNGASKVTVEDCYFYHNSTNNRNYPQINLSNGSGNDVVIKGNTVIGGQFTRSGGIAVSNLMGAQPYAATVIENNYITDNRYGITINGPVSTRIIGNKIISNKYETNANNGGSGISIYSNAMGTYIQDNLIQDNLWGMTIISASTVNVNMGKTEDPEAADYNPGHNIFIDNGNNGVLYDVYNATANTVYAQGNKWNVDEQIPEKIETVVFHKVDSESLGEVIFTPAWTDYSGVNDVNVAREANVRKYVVDGQIVIERDGVKYNVAGQRIK